MTDMKKKLETIRDEVKESMEAYDPTEEFGIDKDAYPNIIENINGFFEGMINRSDKCDFDYSKYSESGDDVREEPEYEDLLNDPDYEIVYEKHGWSFVKDFLSELSALEEGKDYALLFLLSESKSNNNAFADTALGVLLSRNPKWPGAGRSLSSSVSRSKDGLNHFWLLKRK
jgi:hypothetical protein